MDAKEARRRASDFNTSEHNRQYKSIMESIDKASSAGNYECWHYDSISEDLRQKLTSDGYTIGQTQYDRDGLTTKISW